MFRRALYFLVISSCCTPLSAAPYVMAASESLTLNSSIDAVYGNTGNETVLITQSSTVDLDGNIERLELPNAHSNYQFEISGTVIRVRDSSNGVIAFRGLNGPVTIAFADGSANLTLTALDQATIAGVTLPVGSASTLSLSVNEQDKSSTASSPQTFERGFYADVITDKQYLNSGDRVRFTITVGNSEIAQIENVEVQLTVPEALTAFSIYYDVQPNVSSGCNTAGSNLTCQATEVPKWNLGTLASGETRTLTVDVSTNTGELDGTQITLPFTISADEKDAMELSETIWIESDADIDLTLSPSTDPVKAGDTFTYTVSMGKVATQLNNSTMTLTLPDGLTVISASDGGVNTNGTVTWEIGNVSELEHRVRMVTVQADSGLYDGHLQTSVAKLQYDGGLSVDAQTSNTITIVEDALPIKVDITQQSTSVAAEGDVNYVFTVSNTGVSPVNDVDVRLILPPEVDAMSIYYDVAPNVSSGCNSLGSNLTCQAMEEVFWDLGTLAAGESRAINARVVMDTGLITGDLIALPVQVTAEGLNDRIDLLTTSVVNNDPTIDLAMSTTVDPVIPGETFSYWIDVSNASTSALSNATVTATLPEGVTFVSASDGGIQNDSQTVTWSLPSLSVFDSRRREIVVTANNALVAGDILNSSVQVEHDGGHEIDQVSEYAITVVEETLPVNLKIDQLSATTTAEGTLDYTFTVGNDSLFPLDNVSLRLHLPSEISTMSIYYDVQPNVSSGCNSKGSNLTCQAFEEVYWNLGTLAAGETSTITARMFIDTGLISGDLIKLPVQLTADGLNDDIQLLNVSKINNDPTVDLSLASSTDPVVPGQNYSYWIDFSNSTTGVLSNVVVTAQLPDNVTIQSISDSGVQGADNQVSWSLAELQVLQSERYEVTVSANTGLEAGDLLSSAVEISHDSGPEVDQTAEQTLTVSESALPLGITIGTDSSTVESGGSVTYTFTVSNTSLFPVNSTQLRLHLPAEVDTFSIYDDVDPNVSSGCNSQGSNLTCQAYEEVFWDLDTLAAGESSTVTATIKMKSGLITGDLIPLSVQLSADDLEDIINLIHTIAIQNN
ncbi:MAG: DUF11 domain-containing protein [Pseudomonadales bacterium]|nr:DUF11 domain-containing protein [Pseudomonadales bacterium]